MRRDDVAATIGCSGLLFVFIGLVVLIFPFLYNLVMSIPLGGWLIMFGLLAVTIATAMDDSF